MEGDHSQTQLSLESAGSEALIKNTGAIRYCWQKKVEAKSDQW